MPFQLTIPRSRCFFFFHRCQSNEGVVIFNLVRWRLKCGINGITIIYDISMVHPDDSLKRSVFLYRSVGLSSVCNTYVSTLKHQSFSRSFSMTSSWKIYSASFTFWSGRWNNHNVYDNVDRHEYDMCVYVYCMIYYIWT